MTVLCCMFQTALRNALRYFSESCHAELAPEFATELRQYGHIYMYRFMPDTARIRSATPDTGGARDTGLGTLEGHGTRDTGHERDTGPSCLSAAGT